MRIDDNSSLTPFINIRYEASCANYTEKVCKQIRAGEVIHFTATIKVLECSGDVLEQVVQIKPDGVNEALLVRLKVQCSCDCEKADNASPSAAECSNAGTLQCGVCSCNAGSVGNK